jgi:hypothetical protein
MRARLESRAWTLEAPSEVDLITYQTAGWSPWPASGCSELPSLRTGGIGPLLENRWLVDFGTEVLPACGTGPGSHRGHQQWSYHL